MVIPVKSFPVPEAFTVTLVRVTVPDPEFINWNWSDAAPVVPGKKVPFGGGAGGEIAWTMTRVKVGVGVDEFVGVGVCELVGVEVAVEVEVENKVAVAVLVSEFVGVWVGEEVGESVKTGVGVIVNVSVGKAV